jgi:hypothetical protein
MSKLIQFGENVEGYKIPVLNEREIRAAAGLLFLAIFISLMFIMFKNNFLPIKYVITMFLADFIIRVFINPKFSPYINNGPFDCGQSNTRVRECRAKKICMGNWCSLISYHVSFLWS